MGVSEYSGGLSTFVGKKIEQRKRRETKHIAQRQFITFAAGLFTSKIMFALQHILYYHNPLAFGFFAKKRKMGEREREREREREKGTETDKQRD